MVCIFPEPFGSIITSAWSPVWAESMSSTKQCVICGEAQGRKKTKNRNHYGCENSCDACRHFFVSSVKEMAKSSHVFLGGKNADRHCCNNFGCEVKGKRPCTSCRFLKCINNRMNPELPLRSAAREVQKNDPEGGNKPLDDYIKDLRPTFELNLGILLSAAHEAHGNSNIKPAMITEPANSYEEFYGTVNSDAETMSSKQCVICGDQEENAKIGTHFGCKNSCDTCRKFFESSVKNMTKSNYKFLAGKNATRHCYNNFGCQVKGKRQCSSCRFLKCIDNKMTSELPLKNAAIEVQGNDPEGGNKRLDDYIKDLLSIFESNLAILMFAVREARANSKIEPAMISGPANNCEESAGMVNSGAETMSSPKRCVICGEAQGRKKTKNRNHYGCENSCDACQNFFGSCVKNMTKWSHKFLGGKTVGKKADRHCYNNFRCEVKGKRSCTSCKFLKCIENRMNPELPLRSVAREVQENDPEGDNKALVVYINDLRPIFELNLGILLSAAHEARGNSKIEPAMISGPTNNCEEFYGKVYSDVTSHYSHLPLSEVPPPGTYGNVPMEPANHTSNVSHPQQSNYSHYENMPNGEGTYNWNRDSYNNGCTDFAIPNGSFPVVYMPNVVTNHPQYSVGNSSCMRTDPVYNVPIHHEGNTISHRHMGHYDNTGPNVYTHDTLGPAAQLLPPFGNQGICTLNQEAEFHGYEQSAPVHVVQNHTYYAPIQPVNHAGPSTHVHAGTYELLERNVQNLQLDPAVPNDSEMKDTPRDDTLGPVAQSLAPLGSQITGTSNQEVECYGFEQSAPVPVVQNDTYYAPSQPVNIAGPSTQFHVEANEMLGRKVQNSQLDPAVPNNTETKDATRDKSTKRKNPAEKVNEKAKRSISAEPFNRLAIKQYTDELCRILNSFGMKMDTGFECDYGNNAQDRRCDCGRSLGQPYTDPVTRKKTLRNTMIDGPHHFSNWMCHQGLHPDIFALVNPKEVLSRKSICPAGRFYQSRDMIEYIEAESKKENGKYKELKKNELRSGDNYFICCKRKDQQYWQIYYGTDEHREAGYGPYPDYNERRYFFNKEFHQ
ncbi:nuclear receptor subfamily 1 group I member 2 [Ditylenchus destructor]|uniref:Nuclear receptor subfamily 1 group I member 2 n=1 Tax=Ditylenchus destructor TaxID=166010 RepID=A0AAD4MPI4_9BILA|nr:nuclear receptor subfamily 1 group I member 2 [Ditylenchus destructor]